MERDNFNQRKYIFYNQVNILVCVYSVHRDNNFIERVKQTFSTC